MKKEIFCTLGPNSLNKKFLNFSKRNVNLLRINMSHVEINKLPKIIKYIKKNTNTPICIDTEGAQIRTKVKKKYFLKINRKLKIFKDAGDFIVTLGALNGSLGGSEYLRTIHGKIQGPIPHLNLELEMGVQELCLDAIKKGIKKSANDLADGGLAVNLSESIKTKINDEFKKVIRVHPRLKQDFVPVHVLELTIYHEMCHQFAPSYKKNGSWQSHHPEFKKKEKATA